MTFKELVTFRRNHDQRGCHSITTALRNGVLYPIEIKKNYSETAYAASAFPVLDKVEDKKSGMGAVISMCPASGMLRESVLELPVWFI